MTKKVLSSQPHLIHSRGFLVSGEPEKIQYSCEEGIEKFRLSASLVMSIGDPRDGFFHRTLIHDKLI